MTGKKENETELFRQSFELLAMWHCIYNIALLPRLTLQVSLLSPMTSGVQKGSTACIGSFPIAHVCSTKNVKAMFGLYENRDLFEPLSLSGMNSHIRFRECLSIRLSYINTCGFPFLIF